MTIAEKIAHIIKYFEGNSKKNFALKIGTPGGKTGLVHSWLSGKAEPKHDYRVKICEAYAAVGVTAEWLNGDSAEPPPLPAEIRRMGKASDDAPADTDTSRLLGIIESMQETITSQVRTIEALSKSVENLSAGQAVKKSGAVVDYHRRTLRVEGVGV